MHTLSWYVVAVQLFTLQAVNLTFDVSFEQFFWYYGSMLMDVS